MIISEQIGRLVQVTGDYLLVQRQGRGKSYSTAYFTNSTNMIKALAPFLGKRVIVKVEVEDE